MEEVVTLGPAFVQYSPPKGSNFGNKFISGEFKFFSFVVTLEFGVEKSQGDTHDCSK